MFKFACKKWPDHKIIIKVHPDVVNLKTSGCIDKSFYFRKNVVVISELGQINKLIEFHFSHKQNATISVNKPVSRFGLVDFDAAG